MEKSITLIAKNDKDTKATGKRKKCTLVAAYARVSSDKDEQLNSLESQKKYYKTYIRKHEDWKLVDVYFDEGISGLSTKKRAGFNRMVEDALNGKINLILTKSISRFARNTVDTLTIVRKLKENNVGVFFEKENLDSMDQQGDFILTILSSVAEEESKSISANVKWGIRKRYAEGKFSIGYNGFLGYKKGKKFEMLIDEEQSPLVKLIYQLFLEGNSAHYIAKYFNILEIPSVHNKQWSKNVISSILSNEKYVGDALLQKTYVVDIYSKKAKKNTGEVNQYYIKNSHEGIIPRKTFEEVQRLISERKNTDDQQLSYTYTFSSKLICSCCQRFYGRKQYRNDFYPEIIIRWTCNNKHNEDIRCKNIVLYEDELYYHNDRLFETLFDTYAKVKTELAKIIEPLANIKKKELNELNLLPENQYMKSVAFKVIVNRVIVSPNRTLLYELIDGSTYERILPKWAVAKKMPFKRKKRKSRAKAKPTSI